MAPVVLGVYIRKAFELNKIADVYAEVTAGKTGKSYPTSPGNDTTEAVFDELFLMTVDTEEHLYFKLRDDREFLKDVTLGKAQVSVAEVLENKDKWFGSLLNAEGVQQPSVLEMFDSNGDCVGKLEVEIISELDHLDALSVLCCTWNVGNAPPPDNLDAWLQGCKEGKHHIVAVAAQECKYQDSDGKEAKLGPKDGAGVQEVTCGTDGVQSTLQLGGDEPTGSDAAGAAVQPKDRLFAKLAHKLHGTGFEWERHINKAIGSKYWLFKSVHMGQIRLLVFVRADIVTAIDGKGVGDEEATGIGNVVSNKGGVGIGMRIFGTDLSFISAHLAAHQDKCKARNSDYREIIKGVDLDPYHSDPTTSPHYSFFMGDLNYRVDYGEQAKTFAESPTREDWDSLVAAIEKGEHAPLLQEDQLRKQMAEGAVFCGFQEAPITFRPTFKVVKQHPPGATRDQYYTTKRSPAWCDRVLVKPTLAHLQPVFGDYFSAESINTSDHKPVGCVVTVPTAKSTLLGLRAPIEGAEVKDQQPLYEVVITGLASKSDWEMLTRAYDEIRLILNGTAVPKAHEVALDPVRGAGKGLLTKHAVKVLLRPGGLEKMEDDRVLIKIEGLVAGSTSYTLGTALLPLRDVAKAGGASTPFSVPVYEYGIGPKAFLEGSVQLVASSHTGAAKKGFLASVKGLKAKFKK